MRGWKSESPPLFTVPFYVCFTPKADISAPCAAGRIYEYALVNPSPGIADTPSSKGIELGRNASV